MSQNSETLTLSFSGECDPSPISGIKFTEEIQKVVKDVAALYDNRDYKIFSLRYDAKITVSASKRRVGERD